MQTPSVEYRAETPAGCGYSTRGIAIRLFVTCWLIYSVHLATNTVREIYLALAIGDHFSFRVDDYAHLHPDLFEKKGYGWHIGANPGASMLAAIPYALCRPVVDRLVDSVNRQRAAAGTGPPVYNSPWPMSRAFFEESWRRGLDVKFGVAAIIMQTLCMAPISAFGVVVMFLALRQVFLSDRTALWLSLLYAFGTPVFYRAGYLNHNMMMGHFLFSGFVVLWNPRGMLRWETSTRYFVAGLTGGAALLFDYSGVVLLLTLFVYGLALEWGSLTRMARIGACYVAGSIGPVALLWLYQWRSFGNPFYPGQHWMPPVEWIEQGYQGFTLPQKDILWSLLFDYRYGLFLTCPLLLLGLAAFWPEGRLSKVLGRRQVWFLLGSTVAFWLFCGCISYTRLQFNTGIRYLSPVFPLLFVPAALIINKMRPLPKFLIAVMAVTEAWCMAMYRDVERGHGVFDPILQVLLGGFKLPLQMVLSRMSQFQEFFTAGVSPLPVFILVMVLLYGIWRHWEFAR